MNKKDLQDRHISRLSNWGWNVHCTTPPAFEGGVSRAPYSSHFKREGGEFTQAELDLATSQVKLYTTATALSREDLRRKPRDPEPNVGIKIMFVSPDGEPNIAVPVILEDDDIPYPRTCNKCGGNIENPQHRYCGSCGEFMRK